MSQPKKEEIEMLIDLINHKTRIMNDRLNDAIASGCSLDLTATPALLKAICEEIETIAAVQLGQLESMKDDNG